MRLFLRHKFITVALLLVLAFVLFGFSVSRQTTQAQLLASAKAACALDPQTFLPTVNQWRAAKGVAPLAYSTQLQNAAEARVADMQKYQYYGHYNPNTGKAQGQVVFKYDAAATLNDEVLDAPNSAQAALTDFKGSPEHFDALVDARYTRVGVVSEYLPERWADYDSSGHMQLAAGHPVWNCIIIGELADK